MICTFGLEIKFHLTCYWNFELPAGPQSLRLARRTLSLQPEIKLNHIAVKQSQMTGMLNQRP
jgi:hypothetical protein